jgi:hypothetical protein
VGVDDVRLFHGFMCFIVSLSFLIRRYNKKTRLPNFSSLFYKKIVRP